MCRKNLQNKYPVGLKIWTNWEFPKYFQNPATWIFFTYDYKLYVDDDSAFFVFRFLHTNILFSTCITTCTCEGKLCRTIFFLII